MAWFTRLRRWIKRLFRQQSKQRQSPTIIKRWDGVNCSILRLERKTQGAIATYRIVPREGTIHRLLTLDYLPELQAEMVGEFNGTTFRLRPHYDPHNDVVTHRFAVWEIYPTNTRAIGIWDVDLQGLGGNWSLRELAPKRAILGVALRPLQVINSHKTPDMSWASQMARIDWLGLLEERAREELNNPHHSLKACTILEPHSTGDS